VPEERERENEREREPEREREVAVVVEWAEGGAIGVVVMEMSWREVAA